MTMMTSGADDRPEHVAGDHPPFAPQVDPGLVLVVGRSRVNAVVVSRIVERCGLRWITEQPDTAWKSLKLTIPGLVILDGGVANQDCTGLTSMLADARRAGGGVAPAIILLSTGNFDAIEREYVGIIDAVVSKPILPEVLEPVVDRLVSRSRD